MKKLLMLILLTLSTLFSADMKNLYTGSLTLSGKTSSVTLPSSVVDNQSILIFTMTTDSTTGGPQDTHVMGQLSCSSGSCNQINFQRDHSDGTIEISWQVLEYNSGVTVKRGITSHSTLSGTPPKATVATGIDHTKSFVLISEYVHGYITSNDDFTRAQIDSSGNLILSVGQTQSPAAIAWQVVTYQDASVQSGDLYFSRTQASKSASVTIPDTSKAMLVYNYYSTGTSSDNPICQNLVTGKIANSSTLEFDRGCAGHNGKIYLTYYLIKYSDDTKVQRGNTSFNSEYNKNVTLPTAVAKECSAVLGGYHMRGGVTSSTKKYVSEGWFGTSLNATGDEITLSRGKNGASASLEWQVIEYGGCVEPTTAISGTITETTSGANIANASVILYKDNNNDGQPDAGDTEVSTTTTDASGNYSFDAADGKYGSF